MSVSKDELREIIRDEISPLETVCKRTEDAVRGTYDKPGLNQRVASLEQSRSLSKKLWFSVLGIVTTVFGAMATRLLK